MVSRRKFITASLLAGSFTALHGNTIMKESYASLSKESGDIINPTPLKLGLMTYMLGSKWDIDTIIKNCTEAGYLSVELRTTHAHGVEVNLTSQQRSEVKKRFSDSAIEKITLASAFQYHFPDQTELRKNIEGTKEYILLARDVGAVGIRVFPNALPPEVPHEKTLEQIGRALAETGKFGNDHGVEVRVCVHGTGTDRVPVIKKIIDYSQSPYVFVNWNCNPSDLEGNGLEYNFNSVKDRIKGVHIHDLHDPSYPYRDLFRLLSQSGYKGYCNAEINRVSCEPVEFMKVYKGLFLALQNVI